MRLTQFDRRGTDAIDYFRARYGDVEALSADRPFRQKKLKKDVDTRLIWNQRRFR